MTEQAQKIYIGCDPGLSGGFVVLSETGAVIEVFKTPETIQAFAESLGKYGDPEKYVVTLVKERVHSMPKNGAKSNFTFGYTIGVLESAISFYRIRHFDITPQTWMKYYMMKKDPSETDTAWKNRLKARAMGLFPQSKIALWNSDAFLIAEYARQVYR
jgi:hypothetical protein